MYRNSNKQFSHICRLFNLYKKASRGLASQSHESFEKLFGSENKERVCRRLGHGKPARSFKPGDKKKVTKTAAVLVPLCTVDGVPSLLFTLRSTNLTSHKGQVSFPGGNSDPSDRDEVHTALRETEEELGLSAGGIDVWGRMNAVPGKDFKSMVTPVLANVGEVDVASLKFSEDEVAEVFTRSVESLCQPENVGYTRFTSGPGYTLPVYLGGPHRIWGLTAVILHLTLTTLAPPPLYTFKLEHR